MVNNMKTIPNWLKNHFPTIDNTVSSESAHHKTAPVVLPKHVESGQIFPDCLLRGVCKNIKMQNQKLERLLTALNTSDFSGFDEFTLLDRMSDFQESVDELLDFAERLRVIEEKIGERLDKVVEQRASDMRQRRLAVTASF